MQVLINLVKNALKFTAHGHIEIRVKDKEHAGMIKVSVRDTGQGIKQSEISNLFRRYGKLKRSAEENTDGIGLGLYICKELVAQSGGEISVKSDGLGKGACFTFTMPMVRL